MLRLLQLIMFWGALVYISSFLIQGIACFFEDRMKFYNVYAALKIIGVGIVLTTMVIVWRMQ